MTERDPVQQLLEQSEPAAHPSHGAQARMLDAILSECGQPPPEPTPPKGGAGWWVIGIVLVALTAAVGGWLGSRSGAVEETGTLGESEPAQPRKIEHPGPADPRKTERPQRQYLSGLPTPFGGKRLESPRRVAQPGPSSSGQKRPPGSAPEQEVEEPSHDPERAHLSPNERRAATPGVASTSGSRFTYPEDTRPASLIPFFADDMSSVRLVELLFDSLVFVNKRGDIAGGLATHWTVGGDRRSIRFTLREGVTWHDGKPFTAADVVFTIRAAQDPKTLFSRKRAFDFIADAEAVEPHVVEVTFKRPMRDPARRFLFKIVPAHAFKSTGVRRTARFSRRPIGTGPYRLSRYGARKIELVVHEAYWNPAKIPAVEMQHVPDKASQLNLLKFSGKRSGVQAVVFIPPKNVPLFENSDTVVLETYHTVSWWYLAFNQSNRNLKAPAVREAIALAIDREALRSANLGQGDILSGPFVESSPFYNFEVDPREQDLARARRLLDEAGFVRRGKVRRRGRRKLVFTLVIDKDLPAGQELALGLQAQLRQIGVVLKPRFVDHARYREQVFKQRRFDLTMNVWSFEALGDIRPLFHSTGALNFTGFEDDEVDRLLDAAQATDDYKKYKRYYKQLHVRLHETLPYAFLWSLDVYSGINKQVRDVFIQPYYYFTSFETWGMR